MTDGIGHCQVCGKRIRKDAKYGACSLHARQTEAYKKAQRDYAAGRNRKRESKEARRRRHVEQLQSKWPSCVRCSRPNKRGGSTLICQPCMDRRPGDPERLSEPPDEKLCPKCRVIKPAADFGFILSSPDWLSMLCSECSKTSTVREQGLLARYGITVEDYALIFEAQAGLCAICLRPPENGKNLSVDHDHESGVVRGLLCFYCNRHRLGNTTLAQAQRMASYLQSPPAVQALGARQVPEHMKKPARKRPRRRRNIKGTG